MKNVNKRITLKLPGQFLSFQKHRLLHYHRRHTSGMPTSISLPEILPTLHQWPKGIPEKNQKYLISNYNVQYYSINDTEIIVIILITVLKVLVLQFHQYNNSPFSNF